MTVISENVRNIAGADNTTAFVFWTCLRESADGNGLDTALTSRLVACGGVLTTPDLDPGPALVRIGATVYSIEIPDSDTAVRLWPLIQAGLPVSPSDEAAAVRNGGGVARAQTITQAAWDSLAAPRDPATFYIVNG